MLKRVEVVDRVQVAYSKLLEGFSDVVLIVVPPAGFVDFVPTGHQLTLQGIGNGLPIECRLHRVAAALCSASAPLRVAASFSLLSIIFAIL